MKTISLTLLALIAFAANSVLCRIALGQQHIDPAGFTIIRLLSGSIFLYFIFIYYQYRKSFDGSHIITISEKLADSKGSWLGGLLLFIYAFLFSYAYGYLDTGTGALILFGTVQISMVLVALFTKQRMSRPQWIGLLIAFIGFVYLIFPELTAPSFIGFVLMMGSGIAWAGYTLVGKNSTAPLMDTCYNFFRTIPIVLILALITLSSVEYSLYGVLLGVLSGAVMSGAGYAVWYTALNGLTVTQASVVQLLVPVLSVLGGIVFMGEVITTRFQISSFMVLGGIALVLLCKHPLNKIMKQ